MATAVVARRTGLYRCSGIGCTKFVRAGEELPTHTTCEGGCEWEFRPEDNPRPEMVSVVIGNGPFFALVIGEVPKVGDTLNLRTGLVGRYRVIKVDTKTPKNGPNDVWLPHFLVERVGNHEKGQPIYAVGEVPF